MDFHGLVVRTFTDFSAIQDVSDRQMLYTCKLYPDRTICRQIVIVCRDIVCCRDIAAVIYLVVVPCSGLCGKVRVTVNI